jgi:hypothetical protein
MARSRLRAGDVRAGALSGTGLALHDRGERPANQHFGVAHTDRDHFDHGPWRHGNGKPNVVGILRCSASEHGGTSQFASRLIGEREVLRRQISRGSDREGLFARRAARRSKNTSEQRVTEAAVMPSEIEGLPDFCGYLKVASASEWLKVSFERSRLPERSGVHGRLRLESKHQRPIR